MKENKKVTRQGLRDLNYYGPKRPATPPVETKSTEAETVVPTHPVVPQAVDAPQPSDP